MDVRTSTIIDQFLNRYIHHEIHTGHNQFIAFVICFFKKPNLFVFDKGIS